MLSSAVIAKMDAQGDGRPLGVFLLAIDADLQLRKEYIVLVDSFELCEYAVSGRFVDWLN